MLSSGGNYTVELQPCFGQSLDLGSTFLNIQRTGADVLLPHGKPVLVQSLLIALQLAAHTAGHVVVQKQDVFGTALCHLVHRLKRALAVTARKEYTLGASM